MTIQAVQERMPWLMRPVAFVDFVLTPRRWAPPALQACLQSRLSRLHAAMAQEPHHHWRLLPRDLEASISA